MTGDDVGPAAFADLLAAVLLAAVVLAAVLVPGVVPFARALRLVVGVPVILFVPGYVVVTALYPRTRPETGDDGAGRPRSVGGDALTAVERFVLSVPASLAVVALVALAATVAPGGIRAAPLVVGLGAITLVAAAVAARRRLRLPAESRADWMPGGLLATPGRGFANGSTATTLLDAAVVASVVVALAVVAVQPFGAPASEQFSEYQLLAEQDDGSLAAADYPSGFDGDEPVFVRIQNHEGQAVEYTVVVKLQQVETDGDLRTTRSVVRDRLSVGVPAGESRTVEHSPSPTMDGTLRLVYLFYVGEVPDDPTRETADGALHLWVDAPDESDGDADSPPGDDASAVPPRATGEHPPAPTRNP